MTRRCPHGAGATPNGVTSQLPASPGIAPDWRDFATNLEGISSKNFVCQLRFGHNCARGSWRRRSRLRSLGKCKGLIIRAMGHGRNCQTETNPDRLWRRPDNLLKAGRRSSLLTEQRSGWPITIQTIVADKDRSGCDRSVLRPARSARRKHRHHAISARCLVLRYQGDRHDR